MHSEALTAAFNCGHTETREKDGRGVEQSDAADGRGASNGLPQLIRVLSGPRPARAVIPADGEGHA
jgi:hypothetical protein